MKYKITHITCTHPSKSWVIEIEARFPTHRQCTWETAAFTSSGIRLGHSVIIAFLKFWWLFRKEIKKRQSIPGEFELT